MWIVLAGTSAFGTALWTALSKRVLQDMPPLRMMLLFRACVAALLLVPFLVLRGLPTSATFWLSIAAIGMLEAGLWVIIMYGFERDYLATYAEYDTTPLFTLLLALFFLHEHPDAFVWAGVIVIVIGAIVFYRSAHVSLYGIVGALLAALVNVLSKHTIGQVHPLVFLFLIIAWGGFMLGLTYWVVEHHQVEKPKWRPELIRVFPLSLIYGLTMMTFYYALFLDTATRVSAVTRTNLAFGFVLSYFLLKETRDWRSRLAGAVLIMAGTIAVVL